jgi:hypothetical protein
MPTTQAKKEEQEQATQSSGPLKGGCESVRKVLAIRLDCEQPENPSKCDRYEKSRENPALPADCLFKPMAKIGFQSQEESVR